MTTNEPNSGQPSDAIYRNNAQKLAAEAVRLAFQSAEAEAGVIASQTTQSKGAANTPQPSSQNGQQDLSQMQAKVAASIRSEQSQIAQLNGEIERTAGARRQALLMQRDKLEGELELNHAMQDAMDKLAEFESRTENASGGLFASIDQLKRAVPDVFGNSGEQKAAAHR